MKVDSNFSTVDSFFKVSQHKLHFHFNLNLNDSEILGTGETYTKKHNSLKSIQSVRENCSIRENYDIRQSKNKKFYYVLKAQNGEIILTGFLMKTTEEVENVINQVIAAGKSETIIDTTLN